MQMRLRPVVVLAEDRARDTGSTTRRLLGLVWARRRELWLVPFYSLVVTGSSALAPYLIGQAVDQYIRRADVAGLARIMAVLIAVYVVGLVARIAQSNAMGATSQRILSDLRARLFDSLVRQSARFFDRQESGDLQSRLINDVDVINNVLSQGLVQAVASLLTISGIMVGMFLLDWRLALATCLVIPLMFLTTSFFSGLARRAFRETRQAIGDVSANLQEDIAGIKVAQAFNRAEINRTRFAERNRANRDANVGARAVTSAFSPAIDVLSAIAIGIVAGFGGYLALQDQITIGVIVAFLGYVHQFFLPVQQIGQLFTQAQAAIAAAERVFDLVDQPFDLVDPPNPVPLERVAGRLTFEDVHFGYEPGQPVLRGVSFEVEPGQTVALVGPTGAGKTTIVNLVARFYDADRGRILVDGIDVREVAQADLRRAMGMVPQNSFLFNGTIRENIRYGRLDATNEEIEAAARLARAHEFISRLPRGYDTRVGERGGNLSQGQRQLVAIARALLADPRILILDEATSSVDTRTEVLIQQALAELLRNRTSLVIAHRLSTIRNADVVLVVSDGQIVERGTHAELLQQGGVYADLYRRQFRDALVSTPVS